MVRLSRPNPLMRGPTAPAPGTGGPMRLSVGERRGSAISPTSSTRWGATTPSPVPISAARSPAASAP
ncbi:Uncharacterised protein [Mycobacteroides abscessus subsp. abscessus]|nr:Uncharacterised protein [Mycobacteroides abscessus subsp. abscessus]